MRHSECHIRRSRNIQYTYRKVLRRKHHVMVVKTENISRLLISIRCVGLLRTKHMKQKSTLGNSYRPYEHANV